MEADWSVEIGPGLPCIDGSWDSLIDLRGTPNAIDLIPEATRHPALRLALLALNAVTSQLFTTKCDAWALAEDIDPYEFGASGEQVRAGCASYIDILERDASRFASFASHEQRARQLTTRLRGLDLPHGRADFVLRVATTAEQRGYGLTLYAAGCGADDASAYAAWERVVAATVAATIASAPQLQRTGE